MSLYARSLVVAVGCVVIQMGCTQRLDENFCPVDDTPARTTVLLLDTSDPLTPEHEAVFQRLVNEMYSLDAPVTTSDFYIGPGERLVVYELHEDTGALEPSLELCAPGQHPKDWPWWRQLIEGRALALRRWQILEDTLNGLFAQDPGAGQPSSPIIEAIGVIVPQYATSRRSRTETSTAVHLVLYSDLLQHSSTLSHYGPYEDAAEILTTPETRHLGADLAGVEVSIYRLERARDARWQTVDHYYWWTRLIKEFGGRVIYQESI